MSDMPWPLVGMIMTGFSGIIWWGFVFCQERITKRLVPHWMVLTLQAFVLLFLVCWIVMLIAIIVATFSQFTLTEVAKVVGFILIYILAVVAGGWAISQIVIQFSE